MLLEAPAEDLDFGFHPLPFARRNFPQSRTHECVCALGACNGSTPNVNVKPYGLRKYVTDKGATLPGSVDSETCSAAGSRWKSQPAVAAHTSVNCAVPLP
jgi:hypothetical protein